MACYYEGDHLGWITHGNKIIQHFLKRSNYTPGTTVVMLQRFINCLNHSCYVYCMDVSKCSIYCLFEDIATNKTFVYCDH